MFIENRLVCLLTAAISCECQFAGGERLLSSPGASAHVIKEEMLLQGGGEINVFNYRLKGRMKMKKICLQLNNLE